MGTSFPSFPLLFSLVKSALAVANVANHLAEVLFLCSEITNGDVSGLGLADLGP
jgi:hypothetical protein